MSFGWSTRDIVAALKLLHQIGSALRDSGGASSDFQDTLSILQTLSLTLEHLNVLQTVPLDPDVAHNLREQCNHIRMPLTAFLEDVSARFERSLGAESKRSRIFAAPRMIQWALSTSKKTKTLHNRIKVPMAAISLILGQQVLMTTIRIPQDVLDRISSTIEMAVETSLTNHQIEAFGEAHVTSVDTKTQSVQEIGTTTVESIHDKIVEDQKAIESLGSNLERLTSQVEPASTITGLCTDITETPIYPEPPSGLDIHKPHTATIESSDQLRKQFLRDGAQSSSLHRKLDQVASSIGALETSLKGLSVSSATFYLETSTSQLEEPLKIL